VNDVDNQLFIIDVSGRFPPTDQLIVVRDLLNKGYEVKRCYTTNDTFLIHIAEVEGEEAVDEPVVESVVEVALTDDPSTVKAYTDDGWVVRDYYSKRVQLIKHREVEEVNEE
jgi:hypothetical protein